MSFFAVLIFVQIYVATPCPTKWALGCAFVLLSYDWASFDLSFIIQGLFWLSGRTSCHKISWSLEVARFGFRLLQSLNNLTVTSATSVPTCPPNCLVGNGASAPTLTGIGESVTLFHEKLRHNLGNMQQNRNRQHVYRLCNMRSKLNSSCLERGEADSIRHWKVIPKENTDKFH